MSNSIEILAPAGGMDAVFAAVRNGADAVYLGQKQFSARSAAENFDASLLKSAVRYCHLHGVKVYQTLNTVLFDKDFPALRETVKAACDAGVDALIVQDFGVLSMVRSWCPDMPLHASTQMTIHTVSGAECLKRLGIKRVVLARETDRAQIARIAGVGVETEVFVHGALCMSVSGQCYMSALIGGRSGNKGSCAGTCRLPFSAVKGETRYDLSLKDLCLAGHFRELENLGVTSLKIEGRMKRPEYVAAAVQVYGVLKKGTIPDMKQLQAVFSRSGFTDGYFTGHTGAQMFGYRSKGDVLSATESIYSGLRQSYHKEKADIPVSVMFHMKQGEPVSLILTSGECKVKAIGPVPEAAKTRPLTPAIAKEALTKLGGTAFYALAFDAEMEDGLTLSKSVLNALRRDAVSRMEEQLTARPKKTCHTVLPVLAARTLPVKQGFRARFRSVSQIPWELMEDIEFIILPIQEVKSNMGKLSAYQDKIILEPDRVQFVSEEKENEFLYELYTNGFNKLYIQNLGHIETGSQMGFSCYGSPFLNITNSYALEVYRQLGLIDTQVSFEMTQAQINRLHGSLPIGIFCYGRMSMMIVKNCPLKNSRPCSSCEGHGNLTDRRGEAFPVVCNNRKYSEVLNCKVLNLADKMDGFRSAGHGVLYFTTESRGECAGVIRQYLIRDTPKGAFTRGLYFRGIQ